MLTLKEWLETVDYKITEGSDYGWNCFGNDAYTLDSWDGEQDGVSSSVIFDRKTQEVYSCEIHDYKNQRSYRLLNPAFKEAYVHEMNIRDVSDEAYDGVKFVDLEVDDDYIQKALAIFAGEEYDTRVKIELNLEDNELLRLMTMAHELDITLNQLVEKILTEVINREKNHGIAE